MSIVAMFKNSALRRVAAAVVIAVLAMGFSAGSAQARVFVGVGIGFPVFAGPLYPYYAPSYYYPPVYYAAPTYVAPTYYSAPAAQPAPVDNFDRSNCHQFSSLQTIDGRQQQVTGTACRQADGSWRTAP